MTEQYRYDVFGRPEFRGPPVAGNPRGTLLTTGTMVNNQFLFAGREWVPSFGFYENRARAYHPKLGRFMSEDPMGFAGGDMNLFRYCDGDPVNSLDPSGLEQLTVTLGGLMVTMGTNESGQKNFGFFVGIGIGASASYTNATSAFVFPGVQKAIAAQYTQGIGKNFSINAASMNTDRGGTAEISIAGGSNKLQLQAGKAINDKGEVSDTPLTIGYLNGLFVGVGAISYGGPAPSPRPPPRPSPRHSGTSGASVSVWGRDITTLITSGDAYSNGALDVGGFQGVTYVFPEGDGSNSASGTRVFCPVEQEY